MAHRKADLVQETSTSTGTGAMALAGAASGKRAFSAALSNADTCYVLIQNGSAPSEYEICLATYNSSGNTLTRGTVVGSTTGSTVDFSAGTKTISLVAPASKMIVEDNNGDVSVTRRLGAGGAATVALLEAGGADGTYLWGLRGTTKGVRAIASSTAVSIEGVDSTLTASYQPLYFNGSYLAWSLSGVESMRLDSTGLGVGTNTPTAKHDVAAGALGTTAGNLIQVARFRFTATNNYQVRMYGERISNGSDWTTASFTIGAVVDTTPAAHVRFRNASLVLGAFGVERVILTDIKCAPVVDNTISLGEGSNRWSVVYAATGTINTSGRDTKVGIREATDAERRAARRILDGGPRLYKFRDAVNLKGEQARLHAGWIAEDVRDALEAEGLDPWIYGFLCADEITTVEEYTVTVERPKMRKVETTERAVDLVDGQPVLVTRTVAREEPAGQLLPVVDQDGQPVLVPGGQPDAEGNLPLIPMLHFVPEVELVEETRTREVATGERRLGLRYSELEAFLRCATGA